MNRRSTLLMLVLALSVPALGGADESRQQSARDWDAKGLTGLRVDNSRGESSVRPSTDGRVHLVALKVVRHSERKGADDLARDTRVEAGIQGGTLQVSVHYPQHSEIKLDMWDLMKGVEIPEIEVRLALEIPSGLEVSMRSSSGNLASAGLAGAQQLSSSSGDIEVVGASGPLRVDTRSGDATLSDIAAASVGSSSGNVVITAAHGVVEVSTHSGDVRVDSATDSLFLSTQSGEVRVGLARAGLQVSTASGDVVARAAGSIRVQTMSGEARVALIAPLHQAELSTGSGDVVVRVANGIDCNLDADAGSGDVAVDLPLDVRTAKDNHIVGRLGRGTAGIVIRSSSGSVNVAR